MFIIDYGNAIASTIHQSRNNFGSAYFSEYHQKYQNKEAD